MVRSTKYYFHGGRPSWYLKRIEGQLWIGYPKESPDWKYRYVFDSPDMTSGWVEHQAGERWFLCGPLKDVTRHKNTIKCKGPIGVPGKCLYVGFIFEVRKVSDDNSLVRMTCDAFDSRSITLVFRRAAAAALKKIKAAQEKK